MIPYYPNIERRIEHRRAVNGHFIKPALSLSKP
uniref:Uncharacterized protein n=1 Tax=Serratia phage Spe5P4 TaxID=3159438 RepID=A0AAU7VGM0_9CAUD